ncbi:hypothetical protein Tco_1517572 [Tanacetum coccineum]|uniref:Uncharacterized protein n=1 Tax=Tanacetum coccineum TaxID=301880 RepID=A0ABQ5IFE0_9ASTR
MHSGCLEGNVHARRCLGLPAIFPTTLNLAGSLVMPSLYSVIVSQSWAVSLKCNDLALKQPLPVVVVVVVVTVVVVVVVVSRQPGLCSASYLLVLIVRGKIYHSFFSFLAGRFSLAWVYLLQSVVKSITSCMVFVFDALYTASSHWHPPIYFSIIVFLFWELQEHIKLVAEMSDL